MIVWIEADLIIYKILSFYDFTLIFRIWNVKWKEMSKILECSKNLHRYRSSISLSHRQRQWRSVFKMNSFIFLFFKILLPWQPVTHILLNMSSGYFNTVNVKSGKYMFQGYHSIYRHWRSQKPVGCINPSVTGNHL